MNNTRILAIVAVLTATTLVVGLTVAATMTPSVLAGGGGNVSTTITDAQIRLAQAMTALQNKNTTGAMMQLKLLNQSLSTLLRGVGGMVTADVSPSPSPSTGSPSSPSTLSLSPSPFLVPGISAPGPSGGIGAGSSGPGIPGGGGPGAGSSGPGR
jgi:hypothetical protein